VIVGVERWLMSYGGRCRVVVDVAVGVTVHVTIHVERWLVSSNGSCRATVDVMLDVTIDVERWFMSSDS
jgi:hypothetical protein